MTMFKERKFSSVMLSTTLFLSFSVHGLPSGLERRYSHLNSTSTIGTLANTESYATATGLGSSVEISGIVTGDTLSDQHAQSSSKDPNSSGISSQVNCAEYSTASATGGDSADAVATGDCLTHIDNSGSHNFQIEGRDGPEKVTVGGIGKGAIGMEGQVNSQAAQQTSSDIPLNEATIAQATVQNSAEGSAEAYQIVHGPQATSAFSGMMAHAQGDIVHGTQETLMTHTAGDTSIQSLITPFSSVAVQGVLDEQ